MITQAKDVVIGVAARVVGDTNGDAVGLVGPSGSGFLVVTDGSGNAIGLSGPSGSITAIQGTPSALNAASRPPLASDNSTLGYSTSSVWQFGGTVYTTPNYCASDSALWGPLPAVAGTATDIMGSTATLFAGGTIAMAKGFGTTAAAGQAAIDIAYIVSSKYEIATINILPTGELDNDTLAAYMAQADADTPTRVIKIYDQSGNSNHALLGNTTGAALTLNSASASASTTLSWSSTTGTMFSGGFIYGNGVAVGTTLTWSTGTSGTLSSSQSISSTTIYVGAFDAPYIDWDPVLGRYTIYVPWAAKSGLQLPQAMSITDYNNAAMHALGRGISSNVGGNAVLGALGDYSISPNHFVSVIGASNMNIGPGVEGYGDAVGLFGSASSPVMENQPCVFTMSFGSSSTVATLNGASVQIAGGVGAVSVAGGWIFRSTSVVDPSSAMMRLVGFAVFNSVPTAAQKTALHYSGMTRLNAMPQIPNRLIAVGDSRFASTLIPIGFGLEDILPKFLGRGWAISVVGTQGWTAQNQSTHTTMFSGFTYGAKNYAVVLLGFNDFAINNSTVAATLGYLKTVCANITANGFKVILIAELNNNDSADHNANTQVPLLRAAIVAAGTAGMGCYKILDVSGFVPVATPTNSNYYYDGVHPTQALLGLIASAIVPLIV